MKQSNLEHIEYLMSCIMEDAETLLSLSEEIFQTGYPDTKEKLDWYAEQYSHFPSVEDYFQSMKLIQIPEEDSYSIASMCTTAHAVLLHMASVLVQMTDLIKAIHQPHSWSHREFLKMLYPICTACDSLEYYLTQLQESYYNASELWAQAIEEMAESYTESCNENALATKNEFISIYHAVMLLNDRYGEVIPELKNYFISVIDSLDSFANGQEFDSFSFSLIGKEGDDSRYIQFETEDNSIVVSEGGHTYDPIVGGDSYTSWQYTLYNDGDYNGTLYLNDDTILDMIMMGADLSVCWEDESGE